MFFCVGGFILSCCAIVDYNVLIRCTHVAARKETIQAQHTERRSRHTGRTTSQNGIQVCFNQRVSSYSHNSSRLFDCDVTGEVG